MEDGSGDVERLADLLISADDVKAFLDGMTVLGAAAMTRSTGTPIECAVTLGRRKRTATIGGSSDQAMLLDRIEQTLEQGPCIDAMDSGRPVLLDDALSSPQWGDYCGALAAAGMRSTLGVPMELGPDTAAVLNFFAPAPRTFNREAIADALTFAEHASKALRIAIRITVLNESTEDLEAASKSRSVIDTACGVIISQNRCTHEEAFAILRKASNDRNQKLRDLAQALVAGVGAPKQPADQEA
ncbi:GAF domain-containing protein [Paenarthrobacter nitroguajacolicus]|uniref:GAF and ANTAR domain-containing protein n=1 Tax=Paenarthrobacter nitroguajacolicus TaxID=211146 RepID=UPI0028611028|nr:GAF and ANTAR domain-containing protein [Paenarthrobacter nitroguajacolicus]MDR6989260.1 GAF domain-containing protein [Paenarthrobacter nitroguajacolicus]